MTAEKNDQSISESSGANCSTECSSTTPHLGTNDITNEVENDPDATSCSKRNGRSDNEREKYNDSSSSVLYFSILLLNVFFHELNI